MALSDDVNEESIDEHIRELVININRIPNMHTYTTCQGEIYRDTPMMPTKDGWIHISTLKDQNAGVIMTVNEFCNSNEYFSLEGPQQDMWLAHNAVYTINAKHLEYDHETFYKLTTADQEKFFLEADKRQSLLNIGWHVLDEKVVSYIKEHIYHDVKSLPYRDPKGFQQPRFRRCCW